MSGFNGLRLSLARKRRRLTAKGLAEQSSLAPMTITRLEKGENEPEPETVQVLANVLRYPKDFFYRDDPDFVDPEIVSFRSLKRMTARERDAATTAGQLGLELAEWVDAEFSLPDVNLIDLGRIGDPELAAQSLRRHWKLGEKPIDDLIGLLETKGVFILSIAEAVKDMDAFSFWKNGRAFIFLSCTKTPERSLFDTAHELAHLVLHKHAGKKSSPEAEKEADAFASAFLMPKNDVISVVPRRFITADKIIQKKTRWRVSAMALAYRLRSIGMVSEWNYKTLCIELTKRGYRTAEPIGITREQSRVWRKILSALWAEGITKDDIAKDLCIPVEEIEVLLSGLFEENRPEKGKPKLRMI